MITIFEHIEAGRLGNALFKNSAASILSKKFDLKVERYLHIDEMQAVRPKFYTGGTKIYKNQITVLDQNFLKILGRDVMNQGINLKSWCQSDVFVKKYKKDILDQFDLQYDQQHKDDLFVHVRLGDCIELGLVPNINYYIQAIEQTNFDKGYISSDTPSDERISYLVKRFNLTLYENHRADTINFAKNFGNLVISAGTFSWWMAFLSKAKSVFYPQCSLLWHGNIFGFHGWKPIDWQVEKFEVSRSAELWNAHMKKLKTLGIC